MLRDEEIEKYLAAGRIVADALELARKKTKPGVSVSFLVSELENFIEKKGGELAFPVNVSLNDCAAHDTADISDERVIPENAIVKVDVGAHVDGYIADAAITIDLSGKYGKLVECVEKALSRALDLFTPGREVTEISETIQRTIEGHGYKPVVNLTGHKLERYNLHGDVAIPNIKLKVPYRLKKGDVFAVEPFATTGSGKVVESGDAKIFSFLKRAKTRNPVARRILDFGEKRRGLPFVLRWVFEKKTPMLSIAVRELVNSGALYDYHPLKDIEGSVVAQAEHSVIVDDEPVVYTRI